MRHLGFNCLFRVKTQKYSLATLDLALRGASSRRRGPPRVSFLDEASNGFERGTRLKPSASCLRMSVSLLQTLDDAEWDVARVILSRAARSARRTTHFDLDFPASASHGALLVP